MKMEQSFEVAAPIDQVWHALIDIERVAPCLPGANITERAEDGSYKGTFEVRLGPTKASYNGVLRITEQDEAAHRAVLDAVPDLHGDTGARELLGRFRVREVEAAHLCDPTDIDTPDQLEDPPR